MQTATDHVEHAAPSSSSSSPPPSSSPSPDASAQILARLDRLEADNGRLRRIAGAMALALSASILGVALLGMQAPPNRRLSADEITAGAVTAERFLVSTDKGVIRLDASGLTITANGAPTGNRTNLVDHEARIEIGLDWEWTQDNALRPTPRVLVGRLGHDTANNLVTRASILSPEGCHSGEWHVNNPKHDGRTDRDLINELRRR